VTLVLITLVRTIEQLLILLILIHVILSYFMHPYHPVRQTVDRMVEPLLAPIRQLIPPVGMFDLSPLVLLILVQFIGSLIIQVLR